MMIPPKDTLSEKNIWPAAATHTYEKQAPAEKPYNGSLKKNNVIENLLDILIVNMKCYFTFRSNSLLHSGTMKYITPSMAPSSVAPRTNRISNIT